MLPVPPESLVRAVSLEGWGVHSGAASRVVLARAAAGAPVLLRARGRPACQAPLAAFGVASTLRATTLECDTPGGPLRVGTVEHLFAALAGLGVREGLLIEVDGPELPLLDGGAARWTAALDALGLASSPPAIRVARSGVIEVGASRYECHPGTAPVVQAVLELDDTRLGTTATWNGDAADFRARIAPARTFAFSRDVDELLAAGLGRHVEPSSVVVVAPDSIHAAGAPFAADEPARHKLLDLMGDLYLCGGPPLGTVRAVRPGHAANAEACRVALSSGIFAAR